MDQQDIRDLELTDVAAPVNVSERADEHPINGLPLPGWLHDHISDPGVHFVQRPSASLGLSASTLATFPQPETGAEGFEDGQTGKTQNSQLHFSGIDAADLDRLMAALQAHDCSRRSVPQAIYEERQLEIQRFTCLTLIVGPAELGAAVSHAHLLKETLAALHGAERNDLPEADVCRLWLSCAVGESSPNAADEIALLAKEQLWEPVQALAYRALTFYGKRKMLADLLPGNQSLSLAQADAWLEAAHQSEVHGNWTDRITVAPQCLLTPAVREQWIRLITAETALACGSHLSSAERELAELSALVDEKPPRTYEEAEVRRIAARASAAVARANIDRWQGCGGALGGHAGQSLPAWERDYLLALESWQFGEHRKALAGLQAALVSNPSQSPVRLALAILQALSSLESALDTLRCDEPTREMVITRATLLVRLGLHDEAEVALAHQRVGVEGEPVRYSWARGREQLRQRQRTLVAALAERRGNWNTAAKAWRDARGAGRTTEAGLWYVENLRELLREARLLYIVSREVETLEGSQNWLRSVFNQRLRRGCLEISKVSLSGDALFFRATATINVLPRRAARDFQTLLRQNKWLDTERSVGGGRTIFVGDALMQLGHPEDAVRAYRLANTSITREVEERVAVALVYTDVLRGAGATEFSDAIERAKVWAPASSWPHLFGAVGMLMAGENDAVDPLVAAAQQRGAPEAACRYLKSMCALMSGQSAGPCEDPSAIPMTNEIETFIQFLCGVEMELGKMAELEKDLGGGWISRCLADPNTTARQLLAAWADAGQWDQVLRCAEGLMRSELTWGKELAALLHVRHALDLACRGELKEANLELSGLESVFKSE